MLELNNILTNSINKLSGGELQKLMCFVTYITNADIYIFDEPSNFLDVKQRLIISSMIQELKDTNKYVLVIEHDLSMLDYISDELYILFGISGAYGIVSKPLTTLEGINMYLSGYISTQNIRFRSDEFDFTLVDEISTNQILPNNDHLNSIEQNTIEFEYFKLIIPNLSFSTKSSIHLILGENGTGKTTFIKYLAYKLQLNISTKEQYLNINKYKQQDGNYLTVEESFYKYIQSAYCDSTFVHSVIRPFEIDQIINKTIR